MAHCEPASGQHIAYNSPANTISNSALLVCSGFWRGRACGNSFNDVEI
jgi:hypothetical protein